MYDILGGMISIVGVSNKPMSFNNSINSSPNVKTQTWDNADINHRAFILLPVWFLSKEVKEVRTIVKLQATGRNEVQVDIVAEVVTDEPTETSQQ
ncbi:3911_t:CDS:2 [Acaulospora morrowiae]|uniref:3911_t:CDS:1 n=1 Tax=Acaulospora morrowiae TaxID=94023 RepID=A0A9N9FW23_9GLOM|nr:3911_t:CDS:2 [Acaulospora morrowiae]